MILYKVVNIQISGINLMFFRIMMGVQANKYHTCTYDKTSNDFNHSHLFRAALKGIKVGLNARKEE